MNFWDVFGEMLVILFAIAAGYAANRLGYLGGEADQKVSKLLLNINHARHDRGGGDHRRGAAGAGDHPLHP